MMTGGFGSGGPKAPLEMRPSFSLGDTPLIVLTFILRPLMLWVVLDWTVYGGTFLDISGVAEDLACHPGTV